MNKLAVEIGPRGAGQVGEEIAAEYLKDTLSGFGYQVDEHHFQSISTYSYPYLVYFSFPIISSILAYYIPWLAFVISLVVSVLFIFDLQTFSLLNRFFPKIKSQNIIARQEAEGLPAKKVVFVAHYDSAKSSLAFKPGMVESFGLSFNITKASIFAVTIIGFANFVWRLIEGQNNIIIWVIMLLPAIYLLIPLFYLVHREIFLGYTNGANDNASGVAALISIAQNISLEKKSNTEFWFVFTGCEEVGTVGMINFLHKFGDQLKEAYFVNFDNLGQGKVKYIMEEGMLIGHKSNPDLTTAASRVAYEERLNMRRGKYRLLTTDATPALIRRFKAMSIMAFDQRGNLPNWHWSTDNIENIDTENIKIAAKFGTVLNRKL